jgi:GNAT superfamily N-acetyltransferase
MTRAGTTAVRDRIPSPRPSLSCRINLDCKRMSPNMANMVSIVDTEIGLNRLAPLPARSSSSSVQFRLAQAADLPVLARFRIEQVGSSRGGTHQASADFCQSFESFLLERIKTREWLIVIAEISGQLAGCAYLQKITKLPRPGRLNREYGCIMLCVRKQYRGHGLRGQLLQEVALLGQSEGLESLVGRPSTESRSMYRAIGFRQIEPEMELDRSQDF